MNKYRRTKFVFLVIILCLIPISFVSADTDISLSKRVYGENAPDFPKEVNYTGKFYYAKGEEETTNGFEEVNAYFDFLEKNDPDFIVYKEPVIDNTPSLFTLEEIIKASGKSNNIKDFFKKTDEIQQGLYLLINKTLKVHNNKVKETTTSSFYTNDARYISGIYTPFTNLDSSYLAALDNEISDDSILSAIRSISGILGRSNDTLTKNGDNDFTITFDGTKGTFVDGEYVKIPTTGIMNIKYDTDSECLKMHVEEEISDSNQKNFTMYEVAKVADGIYIFQSEYERAYVNENIVDNDNAEFLYSTLKSGNKYSADDSIFGNIPKDYESWVTEDGNIGTVISGKNDTITFKPDGKELITVEK